MPILPDLPSALHDALGPGEAVVWADAPTRFPEPERLLLRGGLAAFGAVLWMLFLLPHLRGSVPLGVVVAGLVATLVGGTALTFAEGRKQKRTRYAVTTRRALVFDPDRGVEEIPWWMLGGRSKDVRHTGNGTIRFSKDDRYRFYAIPNVRSADAALAALPASAFDAPLHAASERDASQVPTRVLRVLAHVLEDGETIRWWGHPDAGALQRGRSGRASGHSLGNTELTALLGLGLLFVMGAAVVANTRANGFEPRHLFNLLLPLTLVVGSLWSRWRMQQRLYVITDRRALILAPERGGYRAHSIGPEKLAARRLVRNVNSLDSIRFDGVTIPPTSLDDDAFVGPYPQALVVRLLDALARSAPPSRQADVAAARAAGLPVPEPLPGVPLDAPLPTETPVLAIPKART